MRSRSMTSGSKLCPKCLKGSIYTGDRAQYNAKSITEKMPGGQPLYICADCSIKEMKDEWQSNQDTQSGSLSLPMEE